MKNTLNEKMGFNKNPFSKFSAEEELDFLSQIFYPPLFYKTLLDDLKSGTSRFILGQRGHGKSSIIYELKSDLEKDKVLTIIIDRFDDIALTNNKIPLLNLILTEFVTKFVLFLDKNKYILKKLDTEDKESLGLLIKLFFKPLTRVEYENRYENIKKVKVKNFFIRLFNGFIKPTNSIINTGVMITSKIISESIGLGDVNIRDFTEFIGEIEEPNIDASNAELQLTTNKRHLKELLNRINSIAQKSYFNSSVILFDKVDEFQELNHDVNKIAAFTKDILTDTELLLQNDIAIAFSLWTEVKPILSKTVRFDKFKEIDISWKKSDMVPLIDKRVRYFTSDKKKFNDLFKNKNDIDEIIEISNHSPRDLISCMSDIYDIQTSNSDIKYFDSNSVSKGLIKFAKRYDYLSLYPSRTGKNKDVISMINLILRTKRISFTIRELSAVFNQKTNWCVRKIELMIKYRLINEDDKLGPKGERIFNVLDPKIKHLIKRNINSLD